MSIAKRSNHFLKKPYELHFSPKKLVQINKHIWAKLLLYYNVNVDKDRKKSLSPFWELKPKYDLCQVWLKLDQWFWRRLVNPVNVFSFFHYFHWFPFTLGYYVPSLAELFTVVIGIFQVQQCSSLFRIMCDIFMLFFQCLLVRNSVFTRLCSADSCSYARYVHEHWCRVNSV